MVVVETEAIRELDSVVLRVPHGRWAAGTSGAVVRTFDDEAALVELVGPDGRTVDMLSVEVSDLVLLRRPGSARGIGPDRLAG